MTFRSGLKAVEMVPVSMPMCVCKKCEHTFVIKAAIVKRTDDYDNRITVDLWDQVSCNYCPRCGYPSDDAHLKKLKLNIETGWGRDVGRPEFEHKCAAGKHWHETKEDAGYCVPCIGSDSLYSCPVCEESYDDSHAALLCLMRCEAAKDGKDK